VHVQRRWVGLHDAHTIRLHLLYSKKECVKRDWRGARRPWLCVCCAPSVCARRPYRLSGGQRRGPGGRGVVVSRVASINTGKVSAQRVPW
jgi:hypothetical protein